MAAQSRRRFLGSAAAFAALPAAARPAPAALTFLAAADVHYRPGVFPHDDRDWMLRILERGRAAKAAFAIQLGDFAHAARRDRAFIDAFSDHPLPTRHVIGNHDDDGGPHRETLEAYRLARGWYGFDAGSFRFLVLDTNYACLDGRFIHYGRDAGFSPYRIPREAQMRLAPEQLEWLKGELNASPFPCVVCAHRRLDDGSPDAGPVGALIAAANAAHPGRVRLVLNGHNHCDSFRVRDGVLWHTVNSPNHCWVSRRHAAYPPEDMARWKLIDHVIAYDTPLSALITLHPDGRIAIDGMEGRFWRGITPAQAGFPASITASICSRDCNPLVGS